MNLDKLVITLTADTQELKQRFADVENQLKGFQNKVNNTKLDLGANFKSSQIVGKLKDIEKAQDSLRASFDKGKISVAQFENSFGKLGDLKNRLTGLSPSLKGADGAAKGLGVSLGAVAKQMLLIAAPLAALGALKGLVTMGVNLEKAQFSMAGLVNSTTQFTDAAGKPVTATENLNKSLEHAKVLYSELQKQGRDLAGVTTEDLTNAATAALPALATLGITDAKEQATLIGTITGSLKQLGLAYNEIQQKVEIRALLSGDVTKVGADFGKLVAEVNGGTDAFKRNFEAAKQNGTIYEFLNNSMLAFRASSNLAASSLDNQFSVLQDSFTMIGQVIGTQLLQPMKDLAQTTIGGLFTEVEEGGKKFTKFNEEVTKTAELVGTDLGRGLSGLAPLIQPLMNIIGEFGQLISKIFGDLIAQNEDVIKAIGEFGNFIAETFAFIGERAGSIVKLLRGAGEGIVGLFGLVATTVLRVFADLANGVIEKVNGMIKAISAPINLAISGINQAFDKNIKPIKLELAKVPTKGIDKAGADSANLFKKGFADTLTGGKGIIFGDKSVGLDTKVQKGKSDEFQKLFAKSKIGGATPDNGSSKASKAADKAATEQATQDKSLFSEQQKNALLDKELAIKKQINALEVELSKITDPILKAQKEREKSIIEEINPLKEKLTLAQGELAYLEQHKAKQSEIAQAKTKVHEITNQIATAEDSINTKNQIALDKAKEQEELSKKKALGLIEEGKANQALHNQKLLALNLDSQILATTDQKKLAQLESLKYSMEHIAPLQNELALLQQQTNALLTNKLSKEQMLGIANQLLQGDLSILETLGLQGTAKEELIAKLIRQKQLTGEIGEAEIANQNAIDKSQKSCNKLNDKFADLKQAAAQIGQQLGQAIGNAVKEGEFDLKGLAEGILTTIINMLAQIASNALNSAFGGGGGFKFGGKKDGGIVQSFASGGSVRGKGSGRSDSIPTMLSNGEFVINADATKRNRALLESINNGFTPRKFATGGIVTPVPFAQANKITPLSNNSQSQPLNVNINIPNALDGPSILRVLGSPEGKQAISAFAVQAVQKQSNKSFNRSTFE